MTLTLLPDVEQLVVSFLSAQSELIELLEGNRIYTAIPNEPTFPLLLVRRVGGEPSVGRPLVIDQPLLQLDAYGGTKKKAHDLISTARAVIADRIQGVHTAGVVAWFDFGNLSWLPDADYTPARPRYVADVTLTVRPNFS